MRDPGQGEWAGGSPATSCSCPVCGEDISTLSLVNRQGHVSRCCAPRNDGGRGGARGGAPRKAGGTKAVEMKGEGYTCRLCSKDLSRCTYEQRVAHVKKCSKAKNSAAGAREKTEARR